MRKLTKAEILKKRQEDNFGVPDLIIDEWGGDKNPDQGDSKDLPGSGFSPAGEPPPEWENEEPGGSEDDPLKTGKDQRKWIEELLKALGLNPDHFQFQTGGSGEGGNEEKEKEDEMEEIKQREVCTLNVFEVNIMVVGVLTKAIMTMPGINKQACIFCETLEDHNNVIAHTLDCPTRIAYCCTEDSARLVKEAMMIKEGVPQMDIIRWRMKERAEKLQAKKLLAIEHRKEKEQEEDWEIEHIYEDEDEEVED